MIRTSKHYELWEVTLDNNTTFRAKMGRNNRKYIETDHMKVIKIDSSSETRDRNTRDKN